MLTRVAYQLLSLYQTYKKLVFHGCMREPLYKGHGSKDDLEAAFHVTY